MQNPVRSFLVMGLSCLAISLFLPSRAHGDSITFTGPTSATFTENGATDILLFTLTNDSGAALNDLAPGARDISESGDLSELTSFGGNNGTCGSTLASGNSCMMELVFNTDDGAGEIDGDSLTLTETVLATWTGAPSLGVTTVVTVDDLPVVPTPEPSSLVLLASGLLGIGILARNIRSES